MIAWKQRLVVGERGQHQARRAGVARPDLAAGGDAVAVLQPDVEHGDVGIERRDAPHGLVLGAGLADDHEVGFGLQQVTHAAPHDLVVVEQEHRHRSATASPSLAPRDPSGRSSHRPSVTSGADGVDRRRPAGTDRALRPYPRPPGGSHDQIMTRTHAPSRDPGVRRHRTRARTRPDDRGPASVTSEPPAPQVVGPIRRRAVDTVLVAAGVVVAVVLFAAGGLLTVGQPLRRRLRRRRAGVAEHRRSRTPPPSRRRAAATSLDFAGEQ